MTQNSKLLAMGIAGGYLLGRTGKTKLALALASVVLGGRKGLNPQHVLTEGLKKLGGTPEFARLEEQIRGDLMSAGRSMVTAAANRRMDTLSEALRGRTDALSAPVGGAEDEEPEEPEDESAEEEPEQESAEEEPEQESAEEEPAEEPASRRPPPKKAPAKKAPPKKKAAKAAPGKEARKSPSQQAGTKKSTARTDTAKKSAARSTGRR